MALINNHLLSLLNLSAASLTGLYFS